MKKRILALLMAMVMVFGLSTSVLAAPSSVVDNEEEVLDVEVKWDETQKKTIRVASLWADDVYSITYKWCLYYNGERIEESEGAYTDWERSEDEDALYIHNENFIADFGKSGDYYAEVTVQVRFYNEAGTYYDNSLTKYYAGTSDVKTFTVPDEMLATPANLAISDEGMVTFDLVEGAAYYKVELAGWYDGYGELYWEYWDTFTVYPETGAAQGSFDVLKYIEESDWKNIDYDYSVCVRAYSADLDVIRNSAWSERSNTYEYRVGAEKVTETLKEALNSERPQAVLSAMGDFSANSLNEVLKNNTDMIAQIAAAEDAWIAQMKENGVEIVDTVTPVCTVEGMDTSKIDVAGALYNAFGQSVEKVELSVGMSNEEVTVDGYSNVVKLDIKLLFDGEVPEYLSTPVILTMPIPAGVAAEKLVILHYHEAGKEPQKIVPVVNADGTMTFVVDGFSTFVVANEVPANGDAGAGNGTANNNAVNNNAANNNAVNNNAANNNAANNGGADKGKESSGTGDNTPVEALVVIMILSAVVAVIALKKKSVVK